jgi:hypothetical protein
VVLPTAADVEQTARALERAGATISRADGDVTAADPWGTIVRVTTKTPS